MHGPKGDIEYTVGGSDVATIFGLSPWTTPLELWMIKKGRMKAPVKANASQLEMGHLLEPIAAHFYAQKTGNTVTDDTFMYQHADFPYALADFDRRFVRKSDGKLGILPYTTNCNSGITLLLLTWISVRLPQFGVTIPTTTLQCRQSKETGRRKI